MYSPVHLTACTAFWSSSHVHWLLSIHFILNLIFQLYCHHFNFILNILTLFLTFRLCSIIKSMNQKKKKIGKFGMWPEFDPKINGFNSVYGSILTTAQLRYFAWQSPKKNYPKYCIPVRVSCDAWLEQTDQGREEEEVWHNRGNVRRADSVLEEWRQVQWGTCQENSL